MELAAGHLWAPTMGSTPAYTLTARMLHWITAVLILLLIPLGIVIANECGGPLQDFIYDLHRSLGAVLIPIMVVRLVHRRARPPLPLPSDIAPIQRHAAHATHGALYAVLLLQPLVGWIATSAYPTPVTVSGLLALPPIWSENRAWSEQLFSIHRWIGIAIAGLVAAHILAALYHHCVRKDRVLMRMITG